MNQSKLTEFSIVFSLFAPLIYFLSDLFKFPLITYFPATDEFFWGWKAFSEESGPAMYWYGWLLSAFICSVVPSLLITRLVKFSDKTLNLISHCTWIIVLLIIPFLVQSLKYYWK